MADIVDSIASIIGALAQSNPDALRRLGHGMGRASEAAAVINNLCMQLNNRPEDAAAITTQMMVVAGGFDQQLQMIIAPLIGQLSGLAEAAIADPKEKSALVQAIVLLQTTVNSNTNAGHFGNLFTTLGSGFGGGGFTRHR